MAAPNLRSLRQAAGRLARDNPVLLGMTLAVLLSTLALALVLDEQGEGRKRDSALRATDSRLGVAIASIQESRRESVRISCKTNRVQNKVLLTLISFSIEQAKAKGRRIDPAALAQTRKLVKPITRKAARAVCKALLRRVERGPPPPPPPPPAH